VFAGNREGRERVFVKERENLCVCERERERERMSTNLWSVNVQNNVGLVG